MIGLTRVTCLPWAGAGSGWQTGLIPEGIVFEEILYLQSGEGADTTERHKGGRDSLGKETDPSLHPSPRGDGGYGLHTGRNQRGLDQPEVQRGDRHLPPAGQED